MKRPIHPPDSSERLQRLLVLERELSVQTDRGAAVLAAAWVDDATLSTLKSCLHEHKEAWKRLFDIGGSLESFASRIELLTLLSVISPGVRSELHKIREIRNAFAHLVAHTDEVSPLSFEIPSISDKIRSFRCITPRPDESPRQIYIRACLWLVSELDLIWFFGLKVGDIGQVLLSEEIKKPNAA